ncbi:hypothetical protein MRB53_039214 [Persea americana]|nr:hypothetical protein MRB53_039214 [Persea americana]
MLKRLLKILLTPVSLIICALTVLLAKPFRRRCKKTGLTILLSGDNPIQVLALARHFHRAGHKVIYAGKSWVVRLSGCLTSHTLPDPMSSLYGRTLLDIISKHHVDIFVPCCDETDYVSVGLAKAQLQKRCHVMQFDDLTARRIARRDLFIEAAAKIGLTVPVTQLITSEVTCDPKHVIKSIHKDQDAYTKTTIETPRILQERIIGEKYTCHCFAFKGVIRHFSAHSSTESFRHLPLQRESTISSFEKFSMKDLHEIDIAKKMQHFVSAFASAYDLTGPMSVNFIAGKDVLPISAQPFIAPQIACHTRRGLEMAYTRLAHNSNSAYNWPIYPDSKVQVYSLYREVFNAVVHRSWRQLARTLWRGRELTWDAYDPWPFLLSGVVD